MQQEQRNKKGIIFFSAIVLIFLAFCIFAYSKTGDKGMEERFSNAAGLPDETQSKDGGIFGFAIEGNQLSYVIIFALILTATALIYLKYRI
jgi:hypothetical protein